MAPHSTSSPPPTSSSPSPYSNSSSSSSTEIEVKSSSSPKIHTVNRLSLYTASSVIQSFFTSPHGSLEQTSNRLTLTSDSSSVNDNDNDNDSGYNDDTITHFINLIEYPNSNKCNLTFSELAHTLNFEGIAGLVDKYDVKRVVLLARDMINYVCLMGSRELPCSLSASYSSGTSSASASAVTALLLKNIVAVDSMVDDVDWNDEVIRFLCVRCFPSLPSSSGARSFSSGGSSGISSHIRTPSPLYTGTGEYSNPTFRLNRLNSPFDPSTSNTHMNTNTNVNERIRTRERANPTPTTTTAPATATAASAGHILNLKARRVKAEKSRLRERLSKETLVKIIDMWAEHHGHGHGED